MSRNIYSSRTQYLNFNFSCDHIFYIISVYPLCYEKQRSMKSYESMKSYLTYFVVAAVLQEAFTKAPHL